jgi:hypothetical protein
VGAFWAGRCYSDAASAQNAAFASVSPVLSSPGSLSSLQYRSGSWVLVSTDQGVEVQVSPAPALELFPCSEVDQIADGVYVGFLVVAVWAIAWGMRAAARAL